MQAGSASRPMAHDARHSMMALVVAFCRGSVCHAARERRFQAQEISLAVLNWRSRVASGQGAAAVLRARRELPQRSNEWHLGRRRATRLSLSRKHLQAMQASSEKTSIHISSIITGILIHHNLRWLSSHSGTPSARLEMDLSQAYLCKAVPHPAPEFPSRSVGSIAPFRAPTQAKSCP